MLFSLVLPHPEAAISTYTKDSSGNYCTVTSFQSDDRQRGSNMSKGNTLIEFLYLLLIQRPNQFGHCKLLVFEQK